MHLSKLSHADCTARHTHTVQTAPVVSLNKPQDVCELAFNSLVCLPLVDFFPNLHANSVYSNKVQRAKRDALTGYSGAVPLSLYLLFQHGEQACLIA